MKEGHVNRRGAVRARSDKSGWCMGYDASILWDGKRCKICGKGKPKRCIRYRKRMKPTGKNSEIYWMNYEE